MVTKRLQNWLPNYLRKFEKDIKMMAADKEFESFADFTEWFKNFVDMYCKYMATLCISRYRFGCYSTRIRYEIRERDIVIQNITGRLNMIQIKME